MKKVKKIITICFYLVMTCSISAAGFLLPSALSDYQDTQILANIGQSEIEPIEFSYSSSLFDTMELFSSDHYNVSYPLSGSDHTETAIRETVYDIIDQMEACGLFLRQEEEQLYITEATLSIAIASGSGAGTLADIDASASSNISTALTWNCMINTSTGYWMILNIDDKSGKIVSLSMYTPQTVDATSDQQSPMPLLNGLVTFLHDYYKMKIKLIEAPLSDTDTDIDTDTAVSASTDRPVSYYDAPYTQQYETHDLHYSVVLTDESENKLLLPLDIYPECLRLN